MSHRTGGKFPRRAQLRHRAREMALQLLYMFDMSPESKVREALEMFAADEALELFCKELTEEGKDAPDAEKFPNIHAFNLGFSEAEKDEAFAFAVGLFNGVRANRAAIDETLRENMESSWRPERLVVIDRLLISLAIYEAFISKSVPVNVAISEAVEIAKTFGTEDSGKFVNGVLGRIVRGEERK